MTFFQSIVFTINHNRCKPFRCHSQKKIVSIIQSVKLTLNEWIQWLNFDPFEKWYRLNGNGEVNAWQNGTKTKIPFVIKSFYSLAFSPRSPLLQIKNNTKDSMHSMQIERSRIDQHFYSFKMLWIWNFILSFDSKCEIILKKRRNNEKKWF